MQLKDFCSRTAFRGFVTSLVMAYFPQATGCFIINNYVLLFLQQSGSALSVNISAIILTVAQIFGGLLSTQMADAFGRKRLNFISTPIHICSIFIYASLRLWCFKSDVIARRVLVIRSVYLIGGHFWACKYMLRWKCPTKCMRAIYLLACVFTKFNTFGFSFRYGPLDWFFTHSCWMQYHFVGEKVFQFYWNEYICMDFS